MKEEKKLRGSLGQLKPIGVCSNIPTQNLYTESNENTTFPYTNHTVVTSSNSNTSTVSTKSNSQGHSNAAGDGRVSVVWLLCGMMGSWLFY